MGPIFEGSILRLVKAGALPLAGFWLSSAKLTIALLCGAPWVNIAVVNKVCYWLK